MNNQVKPKPQAQPKMRFSDKDRSILKATFKDREDLLQALRNLFLGFELSDLEKQLIQNHINTPEIKKVLRKVLIPELEKDIPVNQSLDLWMTIQIEDKPFDEFLVVMQARQKVIDMLEKSFALLDNINGEKVDLKVVLSDCDKATITARNTYINHIEFQLYTNVWVLAQAEELTPEEALTKLRKDSAK